MNKRLLVGLFSAFMAMSPWCGYAAPTGQTVDAPHVNVDSNGTTEDCTYCHFANYNPSDCERCHMEPTAPYGDGTAPKAATHQGLSCQACHNPHVSLQAAGIAGAFTDVTVTGGMSTLTGVTPTPQASWAAKTGEQRGLILWVDDTWTNDQNNPVTDKASFEIKSISGDTVTVKGDMSAIEGRSFDLRRGQLVAKKVSKVAGSSYKQGDLNVQFPSPAGSSQIYVDTINGSSPTGVCQVCHTVTTYWTSSGTGTTHNPGRVCTECHKHDTGFIVTACNGCHQGVGLDGVPVAFTGHADVNNPPNPQDDRAMPATGSDTAGQHQLHAVDYGIECATCHIGTGMVRAGSPPPTPVADSKIQIGFSMTKYPTGSKTKYDGQTDVTYEGTNSTVVTKLGSMTCSTVYCHSDGRSVRLGCATSTDVINEYATVPQTTPPQVTVVSSRANTSLKWDGTSADPQSDAQKCNNCHGFVTGASNPILSGRHYTHLLRGIACYKCHADTAKDDGSGNSIVDPTKRANHANGVYEVKGSGLNGANPIVMDAGIPSGQQGNWNPTTKGCLITCHASYERFWTPNDTETCPDACSGLTNIDPTLTFNAYNVDAQTMVYEITINDDDANDPIKKTCLGGHNNENVNATIFYADDQGTWATSTKVAQDDWFMIAPNKKFSTVMYYPLATINPPDGTHPNPWTKVFIRAADNDPKSFQNMLNNGYSSPAPVGSGAISSGWIEVEFNTGFDTMQNIPARIDFAISQSGPTSIDIMDKSFDPDYNDIGTPNSKSAYYANLKGVADGGAGHAGQAAWFQMLYYDEGYSYHQLTITNTPTPQLIPHTTGTYKGNMNTLLSETPGTGSHTFASNGSHWLYYWVYDNHWMYEIPTDNRVPNSGWVNVTLQ